MKLLKKMQERAGETLVEVLASILILTMSMMVLASGMSGAQKVASRIKLEDTSFTLSGIAREAVVTLSDASGGSSVQYGKSGHLTRNGYYYYD